MDNNKVIILKNGPESYFPKVSGNVFLLAGNLLIKSCVAKQLAHFFTFRIFNTHIFSNLAERISYFSLSRNLIRSLGSTHNFTQLR